MIKARGGTVIATTSTEEKAALARGAGADQTIGYDGFEDAVRELTGGAGATSSTTRSATTTFEDGIDALRPRGLHGPLRHGQRPRARLRPAGAAGRSRSTSPGPGLPAYTATREELLQRAGDVLGWIADGSLDVRIGERYPLEDARRAHEDLEARRSTGKLLLIP